MAENQLVEIGATGLEFWNGRIEDEHLFELRHGMWPPVVRRMLDDDVISATLFAVEMMARQVTFHFDPASDTQKALECRDFFKGALDDMSSSWSETLSEIFTFLAWGWSAPEIVYKVRGGDSRDPTRKSKYSDGLIGWRRWAPRAQETRDRWEFDDSGGVRGWWQKAPPRWDERFIPIEKTLLFRTDTHKGSPEPRGLLRRSYRPWYYKARIQNIEGVGIERDLAGLPVAWVPPEYLSPTATAEQQAVLNAIKRIVTNVKRDEQEGVVFPLVYDRVTKQKTFDFQLMASSGRRQFDTNQTIERYNTAIAMCVLADFLQLGHQNVGTQGLSSDKTEMFSVAMGSFLDGVCDVINRFGVARLGALNGFRAKDLPTLKRGDVEAPPLGILGDFVAKLSGAKVRFTAEQQAWMKRQVRGMPVKDEEEKKLVAEADAERKQELAAKTAKPDGREDAQADKKKPRPQGDDVKRGKE
jgi:hypothetical protein